MSSGGFENSLMILLSRAEQSVDALKQERIRSQPFLALEIIQELVNSFISLSYSVNGSTAISHQLRDDLSHQTSKIPEACLIFRNGTGISLKSAIGLFNHWADSHADRRRTFQQLGRASVGLLRSLLLTLLPRMGSETTKSRWQDLFRVFISDLESAVESVGF